MMDEPTHTQGGMIDHLYIYCPHLYKDVKINSTLISAFYTDHFGIQITLYKKEDEFKHIASTVPDYLIEQTDKDGQNRKANSKRKKLVAKEEQNVILNKPKYSLQFNSIDLYYVNSP